MAATEYATLADVKNYLEIAPDVTIHDNKLNIILAAGNQKCTKYIEETNTDALLKYSICRYVEYNYIKKAGVGAEKDEDYNITFARGNNGQFSDVPAEVLEIWKEYIDVSPDKIKVDFI